MQQVFFHIPYTQWLFPPEGVPLNSFGVMLFICFVTTALIWGPRRAAAVNMPREKFQDMAIMLFICGIAGARITYMIQYYKRDFSDKSTIELIQSAFQIWKGGIVFYGAVIGGAIGYAIFHFRVIRRLKIDFWHLADVVAPLIAFGLAVGRIGCYLNGCCWGQVADPNHQIVPISADLGCFPLLPAHSRDQVVAPPGDDARIPKIHGLQTSTGFATSRAPLQDDPRSKVLAIEPGSEASRQNIQAGDRIIGFNGKENHGVLTIRGRADLIDSSGRRAIELGATHLGDDAYEFPNVAAYSQFVTELTPKTDITLISSDTFHRAVRQWPIGENRLDLKLLRAGQESSVSFIPRTVSFFPTQLYETISMTILTVFLILFHPFRRHPGQVMVVLMIGYACHRFLNEAIRIEPTYALGLTLSQWISIGIFAAAIVMELRARANARRQLTTQTASTP